MQDSATSGRLFGEVPGYRWYPDGALGGVGNNGYSWSSAVSGTNGVFLDFNATWLNPSNANNRAHGLQVRCLQHLPASCFYATKERGVSGVACAARRRRAPERTINSAAD